MIRYDMLPNIVFLDDVNDAKFPIGTNNENCLQRYPLASYCIVATDVTMRTLKNRMMHVTRKIQGDILNLFLIFKFVFKSNNLQILI